MEDLSSRIRCPKLMDKIMTAEQAAAEIKDGMIIGTSGFTPAGYPKAIPLALAEAVEQKKVKKGDVVAISSMGAGFTWGGLVIRL